MDYLVAIHPTPRVWLLGSVLAPHATVYAAHLERGRYSTNTITRYLGCLAHLARWMTQRGLPVRLLDESAIG